MANLSACGTDVCNSIVIIIQMSTLAYSAQFPEGNQALSETPGAREFTPV